ncbi:cytochrome oxidase small assembly protein [Rubrivivax gelatinosus]|uniref:Uncharacterized protein n=1 Tax=Rubrivivax gelatinosus TaxID=28068 RepID=A0A4R2MCX3_RUBGE|nr:cytochrome oxidase small assembly protein [Rubrivivax gelatinosus]TCP02467.1 hypothetical protein EV684_10628 [Rubrivivax gelatinosus]
MALDEQQTRRRANRRLGLWLAALALAFGLAFVLRMSWGRG